MLGSRPSRACVLWMAVLRVSTVAFPRLFNGFDPEPQGQIFALRVSEAGPHRQIPGAKSLEVERSGIGEVKDVFPVPLAVAPELGEGQIVGIEGEESEVSERPGKHLGQTLLVVLRVCFQDGHELEVNTVLLVKRGANPCKLIEIHSGPDREHVNVGGWTHESVQHRQDKTAKAMELDGLLEPPIQVSQEGIPGLRDVTRHKAGALA